MLLFVIEVGGSSPTEDDHSSDMGLAVIAPVSLQIVIERNVLTEKCLSSRSVGNLCLLKIFASSDDQDVLG